MRRILLDWDGNLPAATGVTLVADEKTFLRLALQDEPILIRGERLCQWAETFFTGRQIAFVRAKSYLTEIITAFPMLTKDQAQALIDRTVDAFNRVDIVVNNAGIVAFIRPFLELAPEAWQRIIGVNLGGLFNVSVPAARVMAQQGSGCIVNISSVGATRAHRNMVPYDATKGGIEAATRAMALDLAPHGIRVNAIALGNVRTDRWDGVSETEIARRRKVIPLGREETADDAAAAVVFLCSDDASYITGQTLGVDGGLLAQLRPPDAESAPPPKEKLIQNFGNGNG